MAKNVAITMKNSRACNRCLSHIAQKYFSEFKFGFLRNAKGHLLCIKEKGLGLKINSLMSDLWMNC